MYILRNFDVESTGKYLLAFRRDLEAPAPMVGRVGVLLDCHEIFVDAAVHARGAGRTDADVIEKFEKIWRRE